VVLEGVNKDCGPGAEAVVKNGAVGYVARVLVIN
jgi:hypothetical protein